MLGYRGMHGCFDDTLVHEEGDALGRRVSVDELLDLAENMVDKGSDVHAFQQCRMRKSMRVCGLSIMIVNAFKTQVLSTYS